MAPLRRAARSDQSGGARHDAAGDADREARDGPTIAIQNSLAGVAASFSIRAIPAQGKQRNAANGNAAEACDGCVGELISQRSESVPSIQLRYYICERSERGWLWCLNNFLFLRLRLRELVSSGPVGL